MTVLAKDVATLRAKTSAGITACKSALEEANGDMDRAVEILRKRGIVKVDARPARATTCGRIVSYVHHTGRIGVLVNLGCETDFVARNDTFRALAHDIAVHIASAAPIAIHASDLPEDVLAREWALQEEIVVQENRPEALRHKIVTGRMEKFMAERSLVNQPYVKDDKVTVGDMIKRVASVLGETIVVREFSRFQT